MNQDNMRAHCQTLMKRLRRLPFAGDPSDASGAREEVGETLLHYARNEAHAGQIVDGLMGRLHAFPVPADVIEQAAGMSVPDLDLSPEQRWGHKPQLCELCRGLGFVENTEARRYEICSCPDAIDAETLMKLNAKFAGKQATPERRRMLSTARFMERVGL